MKKAAKLLLTIYLALSLCGCAKCINTSYKEVEVRITSEYYRGAYTTPVMIGKTVNVSYHPAVYKSMVEELENLQLGI